MWQDANLQKKRGQYIVLTAIEVDRHNDHHRSPELSDQLLYLLVKEHSTRMQTTLDQLPRYKTKETQSAMIVFDKKYLYLKVSAAKSTS